MVGLKAARGALAVIALAVLALSCEDVALKERIKALASSEAPVPGNSGILTADTVSTTGFALRWSAATSASGSVLSYKALSSASDNIGTVADAEANGTIALPWSEGVTAWVIPGLTSGTRYYFNVLVRDEAGNVACYASREGPSSLYAFNTTASTYYWPSSLTDYNYASSGTVKDISYTFKNRGFGDLHLTASPLVSISSGAADFSVQNQPPVDFLAPNTTSTFIVRFLHTGSGTYYGTIRLASDDPDYGDAFYCSISAYIC